MAPANLLLWLLLLNIGLFPQYVLSEEDGITDGGMEDFKAHYTQLIRNLSLTRRPHLSAETYANLSQPCGRHMALMEKAAANPEAYPWTITWLNSYGRQPLPGAELGIPFAVGSYDQCYKVKPSGDEVFYIDENGTNTSIGMHDFGTHYCKGTYRFEDNLVGSSEGWCVAESCGPQDMKKMMQSFPLSSKHAYCGAKPAIKDNVGAILALAISSFFVALVLVATIFDGVNRKRTASDNVGQTSSPMSTSEVIGKRNEAYKLTELESQNVISGAGPDEQAATNAIDTKSQPNAAHQALVSFSLYRTLTTVLDTGGSRAAYRSFNGLRFIAMTWIILGHTWQLDGYVLTDPRNMFVGNYITQFDLLARSSHMIINNMHYAVDIFLFLSAILVTLSLLKTFKRLNDVNGCGRFKEMVLYVLHRYWRLTPLFAAIMMLYANLWPYWGSGPLFPETSSSADTCKDLWWNNLLYIQNQYRGDCMGWTWYLALDFQFYVAAPVFVVLLYWKPTFGLVYLLINWLATIVIRALSFYYALDEYWLIYVKPHTRFGVYAQGIAMGYVIYKTQCKVKVHRAVVVVGWVVASLLLAFSVFGSRGFDTWPLGLKLFYQAVKREIFIFSIAWIVFACVTGYGGFVNTFLSWNVFMPVSKLTYCGYLIHPIIHFISLANRKKLFYVQDVTMIYQYLGNLCLTLICSLGLTLVFEVPFLALEKVILPARRK